MPELVDPRTGQSYANVPDHEVERARTQFGLITPEEAQLRQQYGSTGEQVKAAGKLAARTATFGAAFDSPEDAKAIKVFGEVSPTLSAVTQVVGAAAPALAAGPLAGAAGEALGLSTRAAQIGASVAEEFAGNTAFERAAATEEGRDINVGNIIVGTGLGAGISLAARAARGGLGALRDSAERHIANRTAGSVLEASDASNNLLSRGLKSSGERRSVGAAGAEDVRRPASAAEINQYAQAPEEFHEQVNEAAHGALTDAFTGHDAVTGSTGGAARQVHGLAFKEQDVLPHMLDVDPNTALDAVYEHASAAMTLAETVRARSPATARRIQAAAEAALQGLQDVAPDQIGARGAVGLNRLKQELDDVTSNFLRMKGTEAKSVGKEIQKAANALRSNLEDGKTWGDFWAERQAGENRLWSGDDGIIQMSNVWQPEIFTQGKGKAWVRIDDQLSEVANRTVRPDIAQHIMSMKPIQARKVLDAWESTVDQWERMTQLKEESGLVRNALETTGESPVDMLKTSLAQQRKAIEELRFLRDAGPRAKPILDKLAAANVTKGGAELAFDVASEVPVVGKLLNTADKATKAATGRSIRDRFAVEPLPPARTFNREEALAAIEARQNARNGVRAPEKGPQGGPPMPPSAPPSPMSPAPSAAPAPMSPVNLTGKSLTDLGAMDDPNSFRPDSFKGLRSSEEFKATGRVPAAQSRLDNEEGIKLRLEDDGKPMLVDGRHRFTVAKEAGLQSVHGTVYDANGNQIFRGAIPIAGGAALVGAGVLASGNASASETTDKLATISGNARAIQERAALGLMVPQSRPPKLPGVAERFREGAPDLAAAFRMRTQELQQITEDPAAFVQGTVHAFGSVASDHPGMFQQLVTRTQIGAQYLLANLPPSVGISMVRPDGIAPDSLALMKYAAMYDAVFNPGNVIYDVATGEATPTQIRALREVHPDIYGDLRANVLKQIGQMGQKVPFETLRQLDNLFDMPGVAGPAFSPAMTSTMAQAYAQGNKPAQKSLGGESVIAPDLATGQLAGLSAIK
jgi:hypothetical protein